MRSADGRWLVREVILDGRRLFRVLATDVWTAIEYLHPSGTYRTADGYWVADVATREAIGRYVALADLEEEERDHDEPVLPAP